MKKYEGMLKWALVRNSAMQRFAEAGVTRLPENWFDGCSVVVQRQVADEINPTAPEVFEKSGLWRRHVILRQLRVGLSSLDPAMI